MAEKSNPPSQMSGNPRLGLALAVCLTALAACASPPQQSARLEAARTQFGALQNNPAVRQADPASLQQAQQNLQQAEIAQRNGDAALTDHFALLAQRQMEAATTKANAQTAQMGQQAQQQLMQQSQQQSGQSSQELAEDLRLLGAQRTERGIILGSFNLPFRTGSAELTSAATRDLQPLVAFLREHPQEVVTVEGFTDSSGNDEANQQLSQRRADAVAGFLASQGIDSRRVIARGMGEEYPVASNATPSGRQANRRVDVVFNTVALPQTAEVPSSGGMMPQGGMATQPFAPTIQQQGMAPPPPTLSPGAPGGPTR